jgi:hypothetical protein
MARFQPVWPESGPLASDYGGQTSSDFDRNFTDGISTGAKIWLVGIQRWLLDSGNGRLLEREGRLRCLKESQLHLLSGKNDLCF